MEDKILKIENLILKLAELSKTDNKSEYLKNQYNIVIRTLEDSVHILKDEPTTYVLVKM
jgi:hypothetical protein